jgi:hypothetical protein
MAPAEAESPSIRRQAFVAALQWGLVQAFVFDSVGRLARNYYRATTDSFFPPDWVTSIQFAAPLGLLVGGYGGYQWLTSDRGAATLAAHRARVRFVGVLVAGWALAIVPTMAFQWLLDDQLFTVPYFILPSLVAVLVFGGAYLLAYRADPNWYDQHRNRLLDGVQGAFVGLVVGFTGFIVYGSYVAATRTEYSVDGGPGIVLTVGLGGLVGYLLGERTDNGDRAAEFVTLLLGSVLGLSLAMVLGVAVLGAAGVDLFGFGSISLYPLLPIVLALVFTTYLTYSVRTNVYGRLTGQNSS